MAGNGQKWMGRSDERDPRSDRWGAVGAGLVLVLLPSLGLFFGAWYLEAHESIGLPVLAVLGIMVLVGSLAITSTLFRRLDLASRSQPLALPPGSIRATMALALVVLFTILAIAAMRPQQELKALTGVSGTLRAELLRDPRITIVQSMPEDCAAKADKPAPAPDPDSIIALPPKPAASAPACAQADERYSLVVKVGPDAATHDLVKQLVLTIGQLMTMAVSFYFAGRTANAREEAKTIAENEAKNPKTPAAAAADGGTTPAAAPATTGTTPPPPPAGDAPGPTGPTPPAVAGPNPRSGTTYDAGAAAVAVRAAGDAHEGCGVTGGAKTADHDLPEAKGGIAQS